MKITMCPPKYFGVNYEINPWMHIENQPDPELAQKQWEDIKGNFENLGVEVDVIDAQEGCPDMVFVANAGIPAGDKFILSNFTHPERKAEVKYFEDFFSKKFEVISLPEEVKFEGQGDAFFVEKKLFLGQGFRSSKKAKEEIKKHLPDDFEVIHMNLINPNFYHLDTALAHIGDGNFLAVKSAFSDESLKELEKHGNIIYLSEKDADSFAANCIIYKKNILLNNATKELEEKLKNLGFSIIRSGASEFLKSGGAVRCLSLVH